MRGYVWRGKAITEQLLDGQVLLQTASFNLEFLLVQSHFLGCFYRFLPACVESIHHHGVTRGHVGRGMLLWCLHKATCMTMWLYSIHWNLLTESHPWIRSTFTPRLNVLGWAWALNGSTWQVPWVLCIFVFCFFSSTSPPPALTAK